jgi:hypothetical protein
MLAGMTKFGVRRPRTGPGRRRASTSRIGIVTAPIATLITSAAARRATAARR